MATVNYWDERYAPGTLVRRNLVAYNDEGISDAGLGMVIVLTPWTSTTNTTVTVLWSGPRDCTPLFEECVSIEWLDVIE